MIKKKIYIKNDYIISSLGFGTEENFSALLANTSGISLIDDNKYSRTPFYGGVVDESILNGKFKAISSSGIYSKLEKMLILSVQSILEHSGLNLSSRDTALIVCTTKGNINYLGNPELRENPGRIKLWESAEVIARHFHSAVRPIVISNACTSGLQGIIIAARLIDCGMYKNVIVSGADIMSHFVVSGFQSFQALAKSHCKPFDSKRDGLNLGEAAGAVLLSDSPREEKPADKIIFVAGSTTNDANHISGPSRDGEGLLRAISESTKNFSAPIDYISAHGTATIYNDDMESTAINRAGLADSEINSFKGYWGHTLGASGLIETIAGINSMIGNILIKSLGTETPGTTENIKIIMQNKPKIINSFLKLSSGFGGTNAAALFVKDND